MIPSYVYVASSWRNPQQADVCAALASRGIEHYDFKNPPGGTGFSWKQVKTDEPSFPTDAICLHCGSPIQLSTFAGMGGWEPDYDPSDDPEVWRHSNGYAGCHLSTQTFAEPGPSPKGSDWERVTEYMRMVDHPVAVAGFDSDFAAMERADTFVMVLPCGKSAHLELGWAVGAGKRTAILLEDPVEPELMYRMVDHMATSIADLLGWLTSTDQAAA